MCIRDRLMALPLLGGPSEIRLVTELESRPYVDMTIDVMKHFGVHVESFEGRIFRIPGGQSYTPVSYTHLLQEEAEKAALERMGDANEIGIALNRQHNPVLGYILSLIHI